MLYPEAGQAGQEGPEVHFWSHFRLILGSISGPLLEGSNADLKAKPVLKEVCKTGRK